MPTPRPTPTETEEITARRAAILQTSGSLTGAFGPSYLERLREDWPADSSSATPSS